jgi:hypothetical protein
MPTSPNSFYMKVLMEVEGESNRARAVKETEERDRGRGSTSITAMRLPCWAVKMWFSRVVLPALETEEYQ